MKRWISVLLVMAMLVGMMPAMAADAAVPSLTNFKTVQRYDGSFADVVAGSWYEADVERAFELGLLKGRSATSFAPNGEIQISEALTFACRLHSIYHTSSADFVQGSPWYRVYVDYAVENGIIGANEYGDYTAAATRAQFAQIFAKVLPDAAMPYINNVAYGYIPDLTADMACYEAAYHLYRAGILHGRDATGTFKPETHITRAEIAAIVTRMVLPTQRKAFHPGVADLPQTWQQELLLADYMGLPMDQLEKETITGAEMAALLDTLVAFEAPNRLSQWKSMYPVFRAYQKPLPRIDVQSVLFLAIQFIGKPYTDYVLTVDTVNQDLVAVSFGETDCALWELYGEVDSFDNGVFGVDHFGVGGTFWNNVTISPVSGEQPLAYDAENNAYHMKDNATYLDGVMAIARAAATAHPELFEHAPSAEEQAILDQAETRKTAILNTESDWTLGEGGKVYYVSPNGDDNNDGLSPKTAWKSLGKLNSAAVGELDQRADGIDTKQFPQYKWAAEHPEEWITLNPGDVVLLERGGLWRGGLITAEGVTYSAYGEGAKPEIWGSPENGSGAEKWSLLEGTDNIWVYYKEMQDCGGILLNGETVANKYAPFWDEDRGKWIDFGEKEGLPHKEAALCPEFDVKTIGDLRFFNELQNVTTDFPAWCWGKLYLRCDAGNPGEVYDSIEFFTGVDGRNKCIGVAENAILDNLSFKYLGSAVSMEDGATVRNCWVEYCGGIVQAYNKGIATTVDNTGEWAVVRCGECITAGNTDTTVTNTYMAYAYDGALSVENGAQAAMDSAPDDQVHRNVLVSGNIMAYSGGGFGCGALDAAGLNFQLYENIRFIDNCVMYIGMGWSHANWIPTGECYQASAFITLNPGNTGEVHLIENTFYDCWDIGQLIAYEHYEGDNRAAEFRGNTYVTGLGSRVAKVQCTTVQNASVEQLYFKELYADDALADNLAEYLGDTEAKVITKRLAFILPE